MLVWEFHPLREHLISEKIRKWLSSAYSKEQDNLLDFDDSRRQFQELHLAASVNNTRAVYLFLCAGFPGETIRVATRGLATVDSYTPLGLLTLYSEPTDKIECVRILLGISILSSLSNSVAAAIEKPSTHLFSLAACCGRISP
jgi:hypothetical protein